MSNETLNRCALIGLSLLQIAVSAGYLNSLSRIDNWSAVYAEDSKGYLLVADYFAGSPIATADIPLMRYRLFSPVIPWAASFLGRIIGTPSAFLVINILLWNLTALIFYEFLKLLLKNRTEAFTGSAILISSLPFIEWGLPIMVDMGAYFFAAFIPYLYFKLKEYGTSAAIVLGLCIGLALLTKPMLIILLLVVVVSFLFEKRYAPVLILSLLSIVMAVVVYSMLGLSYRDFSTFGAPRHRNIVYLLSAVFFCFHWGWFFFWKGWKTIGENKTFYILYLFAFIGPYLFFVYNPRLFFLSYPAMIPLIASGINKKYACALSPGRNNQLLIAGYIITSNVLTIFHLYIMRYLKIRDWEGLTQFFSRLIS